MLDIKNCKSSIDLYQKSIRRDQEMTFLALVYPQIEILHFVLDPFLQLNAIPKEMNLLDSNSLAHYF